jgi:hypothetical protein
MKKLHVTDLTDGEITAVFKAAARGAVERAQAASLPVPSHEWTSGTHAEPTAARKTATAGSKARKKALA